MPPSTRQAPRPRPPAATGQEAQLYHSGLKTRTAAVLEGVNHSTRVEGQVLAFLTIDGRRRYLQLDCEDDQKVLAMLPPGTALELQNDGNSVAPALAIWLDGRRIDKRATDRQALLDAGSGRAGRAPRIGLPALAERYKAAYTQAVALRAALEAEGTDVAAFDIARATSDLFAAYVAVNAPTLQPPGPREAERRAEEPPTAG